MNFDNFYNKVDGRLKDSINALWAMGDAEMQRYLEYLFKDQPLLAEPVLQNTFPWESAEKLMEEYAPEIFEKNFISAIDKVKGEYRFPKDRKPYKHQVQSWQKLLNEKKSIVVTTGTGSGKTECFMLPVLQDLYANCKNSNSINAIFLYPLNALIASQQKRMDAWCQKLGGITYAMYNSKTEENSKNNQDSQAYPQLISREKIRNTPPNILFTNPSMLEYILLRRQDTPILEKSAGKLRWILLDEAHTLTGSSAAEMALLIRRLVDAFKTDIKDIRFALTSATVGSGNDDALKKFMANLCGIPEENIAVIEGKRVLNKTFDENKLTDSRFDIKNIEQLRSDIVKNNFMPLQNLETYSPADLRDNLLKSADIISESDAVPLRAHFFLRSLGGLFCCTNPNCEKHKEFKPKHIPGTLHTIAAKNCECGWPLLELISCKSCGNYMMEGEIFEQDKIRQITIEDGTAFNIHEEEDDEEIDNISEQKGNKIIILPNLPNKKYAHESYSRCAIETDGRLNYDGESFLISHQVPDRCPFCGESAANAYHFRMSTAFTNRLLSDIILGETEGTTNDDKALWEGRKYISFTDSRQGTAKISALQNQDTEKNWIKSMVYHFLLKNGENPNADPNSILHYLQKQFDNAEKQIIRDHLKKEIDKEKAKVNNALPKIKWKDLIVRIDSDRSSELKTIFLNNLSDSRFTYGDNWKDFLTALLYDQFGRRLPRENSLENLGLVSLSYPKIDAIANRPAIAEQLGITIDEWKDLLKITVDYFIRAKFYYSIPETASQLTSGFYRKYQTVKEEDWPKAQENSKRQNRLVMLICAGLGWHDYEDLSKKKVDQIDELINEIRKTLQANLLTNTGENKFQLNLEEKSEFSINSKAYLCPVKRRLIDRHFRSYSPWITGGLTPENVENFRITKEVDIPKLPYPFNLNGENEQNHHQTRIWISENSKTLREQGVWSDLQERVLDIKPLFLAGEHSAQQSDKTLKKLEEQFNEGKLNILNCSTTMEMGVDIGGISTVLMNNVPPGPANYLQRSGRAGRRQEQKSLAVTICTPNPIGYNVFNNPKWALEHEIAPPMLQFRSPEVVSRHINALLFGKFIQSEEIGGVNVKDSIDTFFFGIEGAEPLAQRFSDWLINLNDTEFSNEIEKLTKGTPMAGLKNSTYIHNVKQNFEKLKNKAETRKTNFENTLQNLRREYGENSPAYKAVNFQLGRYLSRNALTNLVEEGFAPSAGIPTGLVEIETTTINDLKKNQNKENPSYHITRALAAYAPGNEIVINNWKYISGGIISQNIYGGQDRHAVVQQCRKCGYQRVVEGDQENNIQQPCANCQHTDFVGISMATRGAGTFTELIEPAGFAVDLYSEKSRKIKETTSLSTVEPLLLNIKPWANDESSLIDIRESDRNAEILYYNKGKGDGFSVCLVCGRASLDPQKLESHRRLRGGKDQDGTICSGDGNSIKHNVILGGRFQTDFVEIRVKNEGNNFSNDEKLLYSLGVMFTKMLAEYLAIDEQELSFNLKQYGSYSSLFIFDTATGGAGYAPQFSLYLEKILEKSLNKLENCDCQTACTKCLIDRNSNHHLNWLDRHLAIDWLKRALDQSVPKELAEKMLGIKKLIGNVRDDINKYIYRNDIEEIWLYTDSNFEHWDLESSKIIKHLSENTKINFVITDEPIYRNQHDKITFFTSKRYGNILKVSGENLPLHRVAIMKLKNGELIDYYAEEFSDKPDENWGAIISGASYILHKASLPEFSEVPEPTFNTGSSVAEIFIKTHQEINSEEIAEIVLEELAKKGINLQDLMAGNTYQAAYYDRYVKSPFAVLLMLQFLEKLKDKTGFNLESVTVNIKDFANQKKPSKFFHEFENSEERDKFLESIAENEFDLPNFGLIEGNIPHYRYFEFINGNGSQKIIIRPDAGIEHGWIAVENIGYDEIYAIDKFRIRKKDDNPILYTISVE
ncbi:DEAD/DEAH box helicase [Cruoricaptor ignavus]|uniref:DEAD/DEAH box helicase n=1 Tax=Cruoricaptor ignavus TaxID=1118202 RepID=A0A7M1T3H7_9FLAO|nr:DEAD/DEAH box helicase [Cruoricaptor ignavus]QOR73463.1 DEAD/DEAH box helicase [Cruoricaptor ignavus]